MISNNEGSNNNNKPTTSATDRGLEHLNLQAWLFYLGVAAAIKTSFLHPLTVAMARKRVLEQPSSLRNVLFRPEKVLPSSSSLLHELSAGNGSMRARFAFIYRGFGVALVANVVGEIAFYAVLEYTRFYLDKSQFDSFKNSVGGAAAELASLALCTPASVICHRQMTSGFGLAADVKYGSALFTFREVVNSNSSSSSSPIKNKKSSSTSKNYRKLFSGLSVAATALPAGAIWWGLYTEVKHGLYTIARANSKAEEAVNRAGAILEKRHLGHDEKTSHSCSFSCDEGEQEVSVPTTTNQIRNGNGSNNNNSSSSSMGVTSVKDNPLINGTSGIIASIITTALFNPFNVVRTRMQAVGSGQSGLAVARQLMKAEGPRAFMKGVVVSSSSAALEGSIVSSIYEYTKWLSDATLSH